MSRTERAPQELDALDELIESHLRTLFKLLDRPHSLEELHAEVNTLNELVSSFSRRNELIQMLVDSFTPETRRTQIREVLRAHRIRIAESKEEMALLREKSNHLIKRAMSLISKAQRIIDKQAYMHTGYAIETCGLCKGSRYKEEAYCVACKGEGTVLVRQPARKCVRCGGGGIETNGVSTRVCAICAGTGWVLAANPDTERPSRSSGV
jgi:hypothetical protein